MKQAKLLLLSMVVFATLFAGCAIPPRPNSNHSQVPTPTASESERVSEVPESTIITTKETFAESTTTTTEITFVETTTTTSTEKTLTESTTTSSMEKALVSVVFMTDELLSKYDTYAEFVDPEDENPQKIIFTTNIAIKDFSFIEIGIKDKDNNIAFFENKVLYSLEELSPEKPFIVTWMEWGAIPHRGISFIDETGTLRHFYITMSGDDSSPLLVEFINE